MSTPKRTQIYLTEDQHRAATRLGRGRGRTLASVVREALDRYLDAEDDDGVDWQGDPALKLIGAMQLPPLPKGRALAEEIDRSVYDEEVESWSSPTARDSSPRSTRRTRGTRKRRKRGRNWRAAVDGSSRRRSSSPRR